MTIVLMVVGAFIPTLLISRVLLWLTGRWDGGWTRLAVVHGLCWIAVSAAAGLGLAKGGPFVWDAALFTIAPQVVWFAFDAVRHLKEAAAASGDAPTA